MIAPSATQARGGSITGVTIGGPGGTAIYTVNNGFVVPAVYYEAFFTAIRPIDFTITVASPGLYDINFGTPPGGVFNATGVDITALEFSLVSGPAGTVSTQGQYNTLLPLRVASFPSPISFRLDGPPYIAPGEWGGIGIVFDVAGSSGPQTFTARLTPFSRAVPEPQSLVLLAVGLTIGVGCGLRRSHRRR